MLKKIIRNKIFKSKKLQDLYSTLKEKRDDRKSLNKLWAYVITLCSFSIALTFSSYFGGVAIVTTIALFGFGGGMLTGLAVLIAMPFVIEFILNRRSI